MASPTWDQIKEIAKRAPRVVTPYVWGALFLFAASALIVGWAGGSLATLILMACVVFAFAIAVLGFDRLARNAKGFYAVLAGFFITVLGVSILTLFVTVLIYIGTGWPPWLDRILKLGAPPPAPVASVYTVEPDALTFALVPYSDDTTTIAAKLTLAGANDTAVVKQEVPGSATAVTFTDLVPGRRYILQLVAQSAGRSSEVTALERYTHARDNELVTSLIKGTARYTGEVTQEGQFSSQNGKIDFRLPNWPIVFRFTGEVANGVPREGQLEFVADGGEVDFCGDQEQLPTRTCAGGKCSRVSFGDEGLVSATCDMQIAWVPVMTSLGEYRKVQRGRFIGSLSGSSADSAGNFVAMVGPFPAVFSGHGELTFGEAAVYEGIWKDGLLDGPGRLKLGDEINDGIFAMGQLVTGSVYNRSFSPSYRVSFDTAGPNTPHPKGIVLTDTSFSLGTPTGTGIHSPGYSFSPAQEEQPAALWHTSDNDQSDRTHSSLASNDPDCLDDEAFGLDRRSLYPDNILVVSLNRIPENGSYFSAGEPRSDLVIEFEPIGLRVSLERWKDQPAKVRFVVDGQLGDDLSNQRIAIDGRETFFEGTNGDAQIQAPLALARLCEARELTNLRTQKKMVVPPSMCHAIATALAATYHCDVTA